MTTVQSLIHQVRTDYLLAGTREQRNKLVAGVLEGAPSLTFTYPLGPIQPGTRISIDLEDCYVWEVGAQQATVERGQFGTTAIDHATGSIVYVNPRWSDAQLLRAFNDELKVLSAPSEGLYRMRTIDFTYSPTVEGYDLNLIDPLSVWEVRYRAIGPEKDWPVIPRNHWEWRPNQSIGDFASGKAFFLRGYADTGQTVRVFYRSKFIPLTEPGDDITTVAGLPVEATDVLGLGAAIRLCAGREIHRNFDETQGDTRRADEVPPGANLQALRGLLQQYQNRVRQEAARLARLYPDRR